MKFFTLIFVISSKLMINLTISVINDIKKNNKILILNKSLVFQTKNNPFDINFQL